MEAVAERVVAAREIASSPLFNVINSSSFNESIAQNQPAMVDDSAPDEGPDEEDYY